MKPARPRRRWRRRLLAIGIGALLAPVVLELGVRILPVSLPPGVRAAVSLHDLRFITRFDPDLGYVMRAGIDAQPLATSDLQVFTVSTRPAPWSQETQVGFRDAFAAPPYAVVVGDSFAMGWGVEDADTFVRVAERGFGQPLCNLGVSGYGPQHALGCLERFGLPAKPTVVVWLFYGNDLDDAVWFDDWEQRGKGIWFTPKSELEYALNRYSAAYKLFRYAGKALSKDRFAWRDGERRFLFSWYWKKSLDVRSERTARGLALMQAQIARFQALAAQHGFVPVFVAAPYREQVYLEEYASVDPSSDPPDVLQAGYTQTVAAARAAGFHVLDTLPLLRGRKQEMLYLFEDPHWTAAGNRVVGEALAALLRQAAGR